MIEHVSLRCKDPQKSREFYEKALAPIGYEQDWVYGESFAFVHKGRHDFWVTPGKVATPLHIAFHCDDTSMVDAFYEAAMAAGGKDNGPPGPRKGYGYAAFVFDPDGHNIEAVTFPEEKKPRATRTAAAKKKKKVTAAAKKRKAPARGARKTRRRT
jgi:catechol 2,3-dioxygenase-like lactoylglutathione lyase family enzyme